MEQIVTLQSDHPSFRELVQVFGRIGCLSFGGPAGQIALMHRELVEERQWVKEEQYLYALNFCHLLPGPEAQQLATWIGWRLHGVKGGLAAGLLFIIPGALIILALSTLYAFAANLDWFAALFLGIKAAVLAIVVQALIRIGGRALNTRFKQYIAVAAFIALFVFNLPFPLVVLGSGALGILVASQRPEWLVLKPSDGLRITAPRPWAASARTVIIWGLIWAAPLALISATVGRDHVLWDIGSFFSQLAIVTFGGAYAVLAYMAQEAVQGFGWLSAGEMTDGLGLAETTPGPLIMVTQFVGYWAAFRAPEPFTPLVAGIIGAGLTTWVTFAPCFMWIFAFAPWMERMENARWLKGGLATLTAAVVGVIANLTAWLALHVFFSRIDERQLGPVRLYWPEPSSFSWQAALLAIFAAVVIFRLKWNVIAVLIAAGLGGIGLRFIT
jgi:chromate transporter